MQNDILNQKATQKLFASQHEDGWFGYELHGNSWRTKENIDIVSKAINHCINIMEDVTKFPTIKDHLMGVVL